MRMTIEELAAMLRLPKWDDYRERNFDYFAEKHYVPVYDKWMELYEEEGLDQQEAHELAEDKALKAMSEGEAEEYSEYGNAVEYVANNLGDQVGLEFEWRPRADVINVSAYGEREAAEAMVDLINGVGIVSIMSVDDLMEQEGYESYEELVFDHISYISYIPEVYGERAYEQQFYDYLR